MTVKTFTDYHEKNNVQDTTGKPLSEEKTNVYDIGVLNGFTKNYSEFNANLEKAEKFLQQFEGLQKDLQSLVTKDEFETVLATHIIHINESIEFLKSYINGINKKDLEKINNDVNIVASRVREVLELVNEQSVKNNKLLFENALAQEKKIDQIKSIVEKVDEEFVVGRLNEFNDKLTDLSYFVEEEIPSQSKKINQLVINNENVLRDISSKQTSLSENLSKKIQSVEEEFEQLDGKVVTIEQKITEKNKELLSVKNKLVESTTNLDSKIISSKQEIEQSITDKANELDKKISTLDTSLVNIGESVSSIKGDLPSQKTKIVNIEVDVDKLQREVKAFKKDKTVAVIGEKVQGIEKEVLRVDSLLKDYNSKLSSVDNDLREAVHSIRKLTLDEKYLAINKKIEYIEEVLTKFDEKSILTEDVYPNPSQKTSDPLTPLNQNYVTLDQLQKHYQLFINRIQTQLSTLGGGGSSRLWDLDDTDYSTVKNPIDGDVLKYVSANARWEAGIVAGGSSFDQDLNTTNSVSFASLSTTGDVVVNGNLSVLGNTTIINTATLTVEDKNILLANGAASAAAADGAGITVDGSSANIIYLSSVDKWSFNKPIEVNGEPVITLNDQFEIVAGESITIAYSDSATNESVFNAEQGQASISIIENGTPGAKLQLNLSEVVIDNGQGSNPIDLEVSGNITANISFISVGDIIGGANVIIDGEITANGTITSPFFYSESDAALKDNIQPIDNALEKVLNLLGVSFKWKSSQAKSIGVIAQNVEAVVPEIVSKSASGNKTVSYDSIIPLLIEAIKEQQVQIEELKRRHNEND